MIDLAMMGVTAREVARNNQAMIPGRFFRWHQARVKVRWIREKISAGGTVVIANHYRAYKLTAMHADLLKANRGGFFVKSGNKWICCDGCSIRLS